MEETERKPRKKKAVKKLNPAFKLIEALKFIKPVKSKYCMMSNGWAVCGDDLMTMGVKIDEAFLQAFPDKEQLLNALLKTGEDLAISQVSAESTFVKSGNFKAFVPCVESTVIENPDPPIVTVNDKLVKALREVLPLIDEKGTNKLFGYAFLKSDVAASSNGFGVLESYHGNNLPPSMLIPKKAVLAIVKCKKQIVEFGYSGESCTFWFNDGSFIKTKLLQEDFINYRLYFKKELVYLPIQDDFYKALTHIKNFIKGGVVYFNDKGVSSNDLNIDSDGDSSYLIEGLPNNMAFTLKYLIALKSIFKNVLFDKEEEKVYFHNETTRGVLGAFVKPKEKEE